MNLNHEAFPKYRPPQLEDIGILKICHSQLTNSQKYFDLTEIPEVNFLVPAEVRYFGLPLFTALNARSQLSSGIAVIFF